MGSMIRYVPQRDLFDSYFGRVVYDSIRANDLPSATRANYQ
jgi:hypothetical protein